MKKKTVMLIVIPALLIGAGFVAARRGKNAPAAYREVRPERGAIAVEFRETGSVNPRNRLEVKPPFSGRLEDILVSEGQKVKKGEIIAWMSSSERAALIDAAYAKGKDELKKWEDAYKKTALVSPIDGFVILRSKEPGQTVAQNDVIMALADDLIVEADVDETDLRYIVPGQKVTFSLDAFPDERIPGTVEHVAYESQLVSNVTVYPIKIRPDVRSPRFRAGMTATVEVAADRRENALLLPRDAVIDRGPKKVVLVKTGGKAPEEREVTTGVSTAKNIEITAGLSDGDTVLVAGGGRNRRAGAGANARMGGGMFGMGGRARH